MTTTRAVVLQLSPFSDYLEAGLAVRVEVIRWFERDAAAQAAWLRERASQVRAVVTAGHVGCSTALMAALPALGLIAINGVGLDKVDLGLARSRGVSVSTTPGALSEDVADLAVGLLIGLLRNIPAADTFVREGRWLQGEFPLSRKITGRRFGILGLGHIGAALAARLAPFGTVAYSGPRPKDVAYAYHPDVLSLACACDVLLVTCPANASTRHLVSAGVLDALGPGGYLVNVSRGSVVDETALIEALEAGRLAGAALDVFEHEPRVPAALCASGRVVLTPHMASATVETRVRMADIVLSNLDAMLAGSACPTAVA